MRIDHGILLTLILMAGCSGEKPADPGRTTSPYVLKEPKAIPGGTETALVPAHPQPGQPTYKITDQKLPDGTRVHSINEVEPPKK